MVLTMASSVSCAHNGAVKKESSAKLTVDQSPVLLKSSVDGQDIVSCTVQPAPGPPPLVTCTKATVTTGEAAKLSVGGKGVLRSDTFSGISNGQPGPLPLSAQAGQAKLGAI